jgi:DNA-binding Lrp family transcriptional regulator
MGLPAIGEGRRGSSGDELALASGLSEFDRALIRILQRDGRRSYAQIARDLRTTEKPVRRRVRELREGGVIDITTITDPQLLGYRSLAVLGLKTDRTRRLAEIASALTMIEAVDYVVLTTGRYDIFIELLCRDRRTLLACIEDGVGSIAGISSVEIHPYLRLHYQHPYFAFGPHDSSHASDGVASEAPALDKVDKGVILELNRDGRVPFNEIARTLKVSEALVRLRYRRLTENRVLRVMALTNPFGLGFETMAWLAIQIEPAADVRHVADAMAALPSVVYVAICAGRFHLFAEVISQSESHLLSLLVEDIETVPGVTAAEPWLYLDLHYKRLRPAL